MCGYISLLFKFAANYFILYSFLLERQLNVQNEKRKTNKTFYFYHEQSLVGTSKESRKNGWLNWLANKKAKFCWHFASIWSQTKDFNVEFDTFVNEWKKLDQFKWDERNWSLKQQQWDKIDAALKVTNREHTNSKLLVLTPPPQSHCVIFTSRNFYNWLWQLTNRTGLDFSNEQHRH